jgi:hypothetical protein
MLKLTASIFDPLGLILPWVMPGKLIFQRATELRLEWDERVTSDLEARWCSWLSELKHLQGFAIPRCVNLFSPEGAYIEVHVFCDASQDAYGACAYLRCININGTITCNLICSKGFVAPLNKQTIPRLELQAAVKAVKLGKSVHRVLEYADAGVPIFYWTDSMIVLGYIMNDTRRFKVFVSNRISVIRSLSLPSQWRHVGSKQNPADCLTRHTSFASSLWINEPEFLVEAYGFGRDGDVLATHPVVPDDDVEVVNVMCSAKSH